MSNVSLYDTLRLIRKNEAKSIKLAGLEDTLSNAQIGSLLAAHDYDANHFKLTDRQIAELFLSFDLSKDFLRDCRCFYSKYFNETADWKLFCKQVSDGKTGDGIIGYWLMSITLRGLDNSATKQLTNAMATTGAKYDYSDINPSLKLLRRYPTGALSEKLALMMPCIIAHFNRTLDLQVISPFLIARVLGHTGGTRDKLSAIRGFTIANPGSETRAILKKLGVAYVATESDFNPTDDRLYSLRSETDTIESNPLIVSSIASKMLACPVHLMHIDVRWGQGAFFASYERAIDAAKLLVSAISTEKMECFATVTEATHPTGSMVGAKAEVAEAILCLGGGSLQNIDFRSIEIQRHLAAEFTARLLSETSSLDVSTIYEKIQAAFRDGLLKKDFVDIFTEHGARESELETLWETPSTLLDGMVARTIPSIKSGRLSRVNQHKLGRFVSENFQNVSVQLHCRPSDYIPFGFNLCTVFSTEEIDFDFLDCFEFDT